MRSERVAPHMCVCLSAFARTTWNTNRAPACRLIKHGGQPMLPLFMRTALIVLCASAAIATSAPAAAQEPFYKGKRLTLMISFAPGGPTDIEGRLLARHIVKHIDGQPQIVVQNKDGAGGMVGASYIGEAAPRDGSMFGYLTAASWRAVIEPEVYRVDFRTYEFIGFQPSNAVTYVRRDLDPGIAQAGDLMNSK